MEGDPDLMSVGEHCSVVDCSQKDFLPFVCDCCNLPFCLEHRTYARHGCSKAKGMQSQTMVCPLCAKAIRYEGQDPNVAFEAHTREACDPSNYDRVHRKAKCPVPGCKEKLSSINTYKCKDCKANVCLKHRFPSDHQCNPAAARAQHTTLPALRRFWGGRDLQVEAPKAVDKVKHVKGTQRKVEKEAHLHVIANSLRETAFRRQAAAEGRLAEASGTGGPERCPSCSAGFDTVEGLIQHCELFHMDDGKERCPQCGHMCRDAVSLCEHVERAHSVRAQCVLC